MTSAQVVEPSVNVILNSPFQEYTHPDDHKLGTNDMTPGQKPFTKKKENCYLLVYFFINLYHLLLFNITVYSSSDHEEKKCRNIFYIVSSMCAEWPYEQRPQLFRQ